MCTQSESIKAHMSNSLETGMRIRVDQKLRSEFVSLCRNEDKTASQVIRQFMRDYVESHYDNSQEDLFENTSQSNDIGAS